MESEKGKDEAAPARPEPQSEAAPPASPPPAEARRTVIQCAFCGAHNVIEG